ncbi:MAG TPA: putative porin [Desulfuromonadaceae bacterium]|nr:putative porin [Desulfuromonadaceae bacterium]
MKKLNKTNPKTKVALFAGATALMALAPQTHAQSSVDALINRLEQKGILTVDEAKDLKTENAMDSTNDFSAALNQKFTIPDWVNNYKLYGDFRGRFDDISAGNPAFVERIRYRYRLRVGLQVNMKDNMQVGLRLGSGDSAAAGSVTTQTGNPLSNNSTMQDNATKKFLYVDAAYAKWTAINDNKLTAAITVGKMDQPFTFTPMVFDGDWTPEGAAIQNVYKINASHAIALNGGVFVLDEESKLARDPVMYGGQITLNSTWTPHIDTSVGFGALNIVSRSQLATNNVPTINQGNTRTAAGRLMANYNPVIADASLTYKFDSFPLYTGTFPIRFAAEAMENPGAPSASNKGLWAGITLGKSGKKGLWDLNYRYEYLEADAWYDQVVDDDPVAFYQAAPTPGATSSGAFGGTNFKGHLVKANYSLTDSLTLSVTCLVDELIAKSPAGSQSDATRFFVDLMWKF